MLSIRLLEGLTERDKRSILAEAHTNKYAKNTELCTEGKAASQLFLMTKGQAKYYRLMKDGRQVIFYWLQPGDTFGLATLLDTPLPYLGSAEAVSDCEVSAWPHGAMQRFARQYPVLSINALRIVLLYLSSGADRHSAMISDTAKERLARTLANLGTRDGHFNPDGVDLEISNEQLASLADVSPFTVSRLLSQWQREGALSKRRKALSIRSPEGLVDHQH
jgi:CRP-like cAMP-binding protein